MTSDEDEPLEEFFEWIQELDEDTLEEIKQEGWLNQGSIPPRAAFYAFLGKEAYEELSFDPENIDGTSEPESSEEQIPTYKEILAENLTEIKVLVALGVSATLTVYISSLLSETSLLRVSLFLSILSLTILLDIIRKIIKSRKEKNSQ